MSQLLLDTTFLIDTERAAEDMRRVIDDDDDVAIAAVSVAELRVGAMLATGRRRASRNAYVDEVVSAIPVLSYDVRVAESHAELLLTARSQGRPRGAHDLIIAATAKTYGRVIVTADASAFADLPGVALRSHR